MSAADSSKPSRPCTEYNIFFQLERAYILQVLLHAQPTEIDTANDIFHPSQSSYAGLPPLPSRYASVVLPYDWHLPGKEQRRKRKHRKSHGVIGFQDLSLRIARAWKEESNKDGEIKNYCRRVGNVGMARYKAAMKKWKKNNPLTQEKSSKKKDRRQMLVKMVSNDSLLREEPTQTQIVVPMPAPILSQEGAVAIDKIDQVFECGSMELLGKVEMEDDDIFGLWAQGECSSLNQAPYPDTSSNVVVHDLHQRPPSIISNVDIEDDEIIDMWNSIPKEYAPANSNHFRCHDCTSKSHITSMPTITSNDIKTQAQDKNNLLQNQSTFGPKGWTQAQLKEMQHMQLLLKEQCQKMVELENKRTVVARSA